MKTSAFTVGALQPHEIPAACQLFEQVFGVTTTPALWAWKYSQGPRLGSVNVVARDAQGTLLGHAGASVFAGCAAGQQLAMAQVCDIMVAPTARSGLQASGVYPQLVAALQQALAQGFVDVYAYGFAGVRPFKLGQRLGYYREVHACRPGVLDAANVRVPRLWGVQAAGWDIARLQRIWLQHGLHGAVAPRVQRTGAYLQWRYACHPQYRYHLWVLRHWARDVGWFLTRDMPDGTTAVVDALLPPHASAMHLSAALAHARQRAGWPHAALWAWYLPTHLPTEPIMGSEVRVRNWHTQLPNPVFQPGDTDVF